MFQITSEFTVYGLTGNKKKSIKFQMLALYRVLYYQVNYLVFTNLNQIPVISEKQFRNEIPKSWRYIKKSANEN